MNVLGGAIGGGKTAKRMTLEKIDAQIVEYETALATAEEMKQALIVLVEQCGVAPPKATASKRLQGATRSVLATWGTTTSIEEAGVLTLREFLVAKEPTLFAQLFVLQDPPVYIPPPPTHRIVGDLFAVLHGLEKRLPRVTENKIAGLYAAAVKRSPKAPSLKVEAEK